MNTFNIAQLIAITLLLIVATMLVTRLFGANPIVSILTGIVITLGVYALWNMTNRFR